MVDPLLQHPLQQVANFRKGRSLGRVFCPARLLTSVSHTFRVTASRMAAVIRLCGSGVLNTMSTSQTRLQRARTCGQKFHGMGLSNIKPCEHRTRPPGTAVRNHTIASHTCMRSDQALGHFLLIGGRCDPRITCENSKMRFGPNTKIDLATESSGSLTGGT